MRPILCVMVLALVLGTVRPVEIIAHRGAPYFLPEHTLASYEMAIRQGADWIEPDLCFTKDGHLVAVHDVNLGSVTNIATHSELKHRNRTVTFPNGAKVNGYVTSDFTLEEIKSLRVKQRVQFRGTRYDGFFTVPTFDEILSLLSRMNAQMRTDVGVYVETKHPAYFESVGHIFDDPLLYTLKKHGYTLQGTRAQSERAIIQSFETTNLRRLRQKTGLRLILLVEAYSSQNPVTTTEDTLTDAWMYLTGNGLDSIHTHIDGLGPHKSTLLATQPYETRKDILIGKELVNKCLDLGLQIHPYTFRNVYEDDALDRFDGDAISEYMYLLQLGVTGFFTENAGMAICAVHEHQALESLRVKREQSSKVDDRDSPLRGHSYPATAVILMILAAGVLGLLGGVLLGMYLTRRTNDFHRLHSKRTV